MRKNSSQLPVVRSQGDVSRLRRERGVLNPAPYTHVLSKRSASNGLSPKVNPQSGFTLLELVVVVAILSILLLGVVFLLKPGQMTARARDATRVSDLDTLVDAIEFANAEGLEIELGGADPDAANTNTCLGESSQTVYVSVPNSETPPSDLPLGWTYGQVLAADLQNVNGTGWLPVNMASGSTQSPISALPIDPDNTFANGFYYTYTCSRSGGYEMTARMASDERRTGGKGDVQSDDGGDDVFAYEVGSDLSLDPKAPIGYWALNEGSGTVASDSSGNGNNGTLINETTWTSGVMETGLTFDGANDRVDLTGTLALDSAGFTISHWIKTNSALGQLYTIGNAGSGDGYRFGLSAGRIAFLLGDSGNTEAACGTATVNDDAWHLITGIYESGSTFSCYIDGTFEDSVAVGSYPNMQTAAPDFGAPPCCQDLDGEMDEVLIYDRALTAEEIAYQYNALRP